MEDRYLPKSRGRDIAVINGPHVVQAGWDLSDLNVMSRAALKRGGLLQLKEEIQSGLEEVRVYRVEA